MHVPRNEQALAQDLHGVDAPGVPLAHLQHLPVAALSQQVQHLKVVHAERLGLDRGPHAIMGENARKVRTIDMRLGP